MVVRLALGLLYAAALSSCGDDPESGGCGLEENCMDLPTYTAGMTVDGDDDLLSVRLVSVDPAPPGAEDSTWTVEILNAVGDVSPDTTLTAVNSWSIDCGHYGTEAGGGVDVTDNDDADTFTFNPDYAHGGPWEVRIDATAGGVSDRIVVGFCLPQTEPHHHP